MDFEWMAWTQTTAAFFGVIAAILIGMTVWEIRSPSVMRRGLLPIPTTRGDRLFLSLMSAAFIHIAWVWGTEAEALWTPLGISVLWAAAMMRFG